MSMIEGAAWTEGLRQKDCSRLPKKALKRKKKGTENFKQTQRHLLGKLGKK